MQATCEPSPFKQQIKQVMPKRPISKWAAFTRPMAHTSYGLNRLSKDLSSYAQLYVLYYFLLY